MTAPSVASERELWAALGEPSRLSVLNALLERGDGTPTMLAHRLPLTRQAVSKHLVVLSRAGLVAGRRQGREVRYVVDPERLTEAARTMNAVAAQWDHRLAAIKRIAEAVQVGRQVAAGDR
ncbi:MAG: ArsR/SmtB family transcription factor [Candidatus Limnocylindrales bacterium]